MNLNLFLILSFCLGWWEIEGVLDGCTIVYVSEFILTSFFAYIREIQLRAYINIYVKVIWSFLFISIDYLNYGNQFDKIQLACAKYNL